MSHQSRFRLVLGVIVFLFVSVSQADAYLLVFKDGFVLRGKIRKDRTVIVDKASGRPISIPVSGRPYYLETNARYVMFTPQDVHDIIEDPTPATPDWMKLKLHGTRAFNRQPLYTDWEYASISPFNERWERIVQIKRLTPDGRPVPLPGNKFMGATVKQRLTLLTPDLFQVQSLNYHFSQSFLTGELHPKELYRLLEIKLKKDDKLNDLDIKLKIAQFFSHAGHTKLAVEQLEKLRETRPNDASRIDPVLEPLKRLRALGTVRHIEEAFRNHQYATAKSGLDEYFDKDYEDIIAERDALRVYEVKSKMDKAKKQLEKTDLYLKFFPTLFEEKDRPEVAKITEEMRTALTFDNMERLQIFHDLTESYANALKQERKPASTPEGLLAHAITGWLMGNRSARGNYDFAQRLWKVRSQLQQYLTTNDLIVRARLVESMSGHKDIDIVLISKLLETLPPLDPHKTINTKVQEITIDVPNAGAGGTFHLQLPPDYNHNRAHPVLIVLHQSGVKATDVMARWSKLAAENGFILVAPVWSEAGQAEYRYSDAEQQIVLNTIRHLRRHFRVDSDRVFLFGCEQGGFMALDIGAAHPDLFAGILSMAAFPRFHANAYWHNIQYLPHYIVDGDRNGKSWQYNENQVKDMIRMQYPVIYTTYVGRGGEWFEGELPFMMDWMTRKKRQFPLKQIGALNNIGGPGKVFRTARHGDNRYYWLSTNQISNRHINHAVTWNTHLRPASMKARIFAGNQIHIDTSGLGQISVWLAPGMVDFAKPVQIRLNGRVVAASLAVEPKLEVMLADYLDRLDRRQLYVEKIDMNVTR